MAHDRMANVKKDVTVKLVLSYVFDWVILIIGAALAGAFSVIEPNKRPFGINDPDISCVHPKDPSTVYTCIHLAYYCQYSC